MLTEDSLLLIYANSTGGALVRVVEPTKEHPDPRDRISHIISKERLSGRFLVFSPDNVLQDFTVEWKPEFNHK